MNDKQQKVICQNCHQEFSIESEDFSFYEKIKVPPPTWCPECRTVRRMLFRNERSLSHKKCKLCDKNIISVYSKDSKMKVYCQECWWSDDWDPFSFSKELDFSISFFSQMKELYQEVPQMSLFNTKSINSDYCNFAAENKNSYLFFGGKNNDSVLYSHNTAGSKETIDVSASEKLELCYECIECKNSNRLFFCRNCENCVDSYFLYECRNCTDCFGCTNLRNKQYCLFNEQLSKENYSEKLKKIKLGSFIKKEEIKNKFREVYLNSIHRFSYQINTKNCTGNNIKNARNTKYCFDIMGNDSENNKYTTHVVLGIKDSYDNYGVSRAEMLYETIAIGFDSNEHSNCKFSFFVRGGTDVSYSINCANSDHIFGCVSLRNKQYCILNKQYTREEYEELVPKIIQHMNDMPYIDAKGRVYKYGEFFPPELSPFAYNETIAGEYFPLTKEEALKQGYKWKEKEARNYQIDISNKDIPDDIKEVKENIIGKVIECNHKDCNHQCTEAFKIIEPEYQFYKRMNLPLPRLCPNCRHYERLAQRNPLKLWHRKCMKEGCSNEFETSYAPERPEIVYCEQCYNKEVY